MGIMGTDREKIEKLVGYLLMKKKGKKFKPKMSITWYEDGTMHVEEKNNSTMPLLQKKSRD
jgi:hypothetical protein